MLSQDLTEILESPFILRHWDLRLQALLLRQQALDLEAALAHKLQTRPLTLPPASHYVTGYRNLVPPQYLAPRAINPQLIPALCVFGD